MNTKTIKLVGYLVATLVLAVMGVLFVASFIEGRLNSWPRAIYEARVALYAQILMTAFFLTFPRKWNRRLGVVGVLGSLVCSGFGLALPSIPLIILGGFGVYAILGGYCASRVAKYIVPQKAIEWVRKPWLN